MKKGLLTSIVTLALSFSLFSCGGESTEQVVLTFDPNGGELDETSKIVDKGSSTTLPIPTKGEKAFIGWFTGWEESDVQVDDTTIFEEDVSLIAKWNKYDVNFRNDDSSILVSQEVEAGNVALYPEEIPYKKSSDPEKEYVFENWDFNFSTKINEDKSIDGIYRLEDLEVVTLDMPSVMNEEKTYQMEFTYGDTMFNNINTFNKDLAVTLFGASMASMNKALLGEYYTGLAYSELYFSESYDVEPTTDSIAYAFALNTTRGRTVVSITVRGFNYGQEWASNFNLGESGNHAGFDRAATTIYDDLKYYVEEKGIDTNDIIFTVTGYSRGGAVANVLADKMFTDMSWCAKTNNTYVYTFEAPKGVLKRLGLEYPNVYNIINSADLIPTFAPDQYGFTRCGRDIEIYRDQVDSLVSLFDEEIELGEFVPSEGNYSTETELPGFIINRVVSFESSSEEFQKYQMRTREEYIANIQPIVQYVFTLIYSIKEETKEAIIADFKTKTTSDLISILFGTDGVYNYVKPFLDKDGYEYDDAELKGYCNDVLALLFKPFASVIAVYMSGGTTFTRMINMHYPEVTYILLKNL